MPRVIARLKNLNLHARLPMLGSVTGLHRSPHRGSSLEFAEYRKYVPGDDTRRLDWRAYGRSDRFYIKEFEADTNLRLCLIVDTSGSMNYARGGISKLQFARQLAGTWPTWRPGRAMRSDCTVPARPFHTVIPPKRNAGHLRSGARPVGGAARRGETGLAEALHEAAESIASAGFGGGDLGSLPRTSVLKSCFQHLRFRKHDVAVFHLLDQSEVDFAFDRPTRFLDLEGGAPILTDPLLVNRQYQKAIQRVSGGSRNGHAGGGR
jgi:hypothetical protein